MSRFSPDSASYPAISMRGHALHIFFFSLNLPGAHLQCDYFFPPKDGLACEFRLPLIFLPACDSLFFPPKLFLCEMDPLALMPRRNQPNDIPQRFDIPGAVVLFHSIFFSFNPGQGGVRLSVGGRTNLSAPRLSSPGRRSAPVLQGLLRHD